MFSRRWLSRTVDQSVMLRCYLAAVLSFLGVEHGVMALHGDTATEFRWKELKNGGRQREMYMRCMNCLRRTEGWTLDRPAPKVTAPWPIPVVDTAQPEQPIAAEVQVAPGILMMDAPGSHHVVH